MVAWPSVDDLKQVLNIESDDWDWKATLDLNAGIAIAKKLRGNWDEGTDEPDDALSQAALRLAELVAERPDATPGALAHDPTVERLLYGQRQSFGIA